MRPDVPLMVLGAVTLVSIVGASYAPGRWRYLLAAVAMVSFATEAAVRGEHGDWVLTGVYSGCALVLASALGPRAWRGLRHRWARNRAETDRLQEGKR